MQTALVTGAAGFIGSNLVDRLLDLGYRVHGVDNLSTGQIKFLGRAFNNCNFTFHNFDLLDVPCLNKLFESHIDVVFHFAANADVRGGVTNTFIDLQQNTLVTYNILESMRIHGVSNILFSSTGSIYGESKIIPTPEECAFPIQTSLYGASKLACEGLIQAYAEAFNFKTWIFRFVSILGERYSHGHVFDFYRQLSIDPSKLKVLGNGLQRKSYLHISDCLAAILKCFSSESSGVNIFNLGVDSTCTVNQSISWICEEMGCNPELFYAGGDRGWVGDNPHIHLDTSKVNDLGWQPHHSIEESVKATVKYLSENPWLFDARL